MNREEKEDYLECLKNKTITGTPEISGGFSGICMDGTGNLGTFRTRGFPGNTEYGNFILVFNCFTEWYNSVKLYSGYTYVSVTDLTIVEKFEKLNEDDFYELLRLEHIKVCEHKLNNL